MWSDKCKSAQWLASGSLAAGRYSVITLDTGQQQCPCLLRNYPDSQNQQQTSTLALIISTNLTHLTTLGTTVLYSKAHVQTWEVMWRISLKHPPHFVDPNKASTKTARKCVNGLCSVLCGFNVVYSGQGVKVTLSPLYQCWPQRPSSIHLPLSWCHPLYTHHTATGVDTARTSNLAHQQLSCKLATINLIQQKSFSRDSITSKNHQLSPDVPVLSRIISARGWGWC